ncbi:MAG: phosphocholine cytidylyltransferase family protein [Sedimentisphaerales bacterium]|nr:phosphocholine cytidylyltransferase family protein [Sedimentisphaerales bacterium]
MQAVILAAGYGKRLQPITNRIPKCLVPVNGKPLLVRSLELLDVRGVDNVVIVVGHMKEKVYEAIGHQFGNMKISYIENDIYDKTNNVYSLWLARDRLNEESLLLECDLCYDGSLIDALLDKRRNCGVLVSKYDGSTMDGTVVRIGEENLIKELITKKAQGPDFDYSDKYKTVNIYYFSRDFLLKFFVPYLDLYVRVHGVQSYFELVLGALIYLSEPEISAVVVDANSWCEIDDRDDLSRAEHRYFG